MVRGRTYAATCRLYNPGVSLCPLLSFVNLVLAPQLSVDLRCFVVKDYGVPYLNNQYHHWVAFRSRASTSLE